MTIRDPQAAIGTFVFSALDYTSDDGTDLRWTALAMYPNPTDPGTPPSRHGGRRGGEPRATDARAAKIALERISIPQDTIDRIREVASPGSAVIVSDEALSNETGKSTDFVVLMSGELQGGIKIRKRNNDAPSAWRRDRDPYGDYGYRRPYYQRSSPTIPVAAGHSAGGETDRLTGHQNHKVLAAKSLSGAASLVFWPSTAAVLTAVAPPLAATRSFESAPRSARCAFEGRLPFQRSPYYGLSPFGWRLAHGTSRDPKREVLVQPLFA